ncbi:NAD-dependent epimerase/dehydratase family protein [bacterium]|jgi:UDP-glucose 4-epimerase|nr:NAD-dependent epimerase/dehydratase family protein [bacterium]|tara:strand:+ start:585 stop:1427 length:843 start_codon:yes stop_codon:yes gene_type:complete
MKVLVTGGEGFVGHHLAKRLIKEEHQVTILDTWRFGEEKRDRLDARYELEGTRNISQLKPEFDWIFHLGEYSRVETSFKDVKKVWESNVAGTTSVVEFAIKCNAKLIYTCTSSVTASEGAYLSPYTWSKARNADLIKASGKWFGLNYAICYLYNVYGGTETSTGNLATVIAKWKKLAKQGSPLPVTSPGNQRRYFTHIEDIVDGLMIIAEKGTGDNLGIGAEKSYSMLQVAQMFNAEIRMTPEVQGNRTTSSLLTKKTKELGWSPKIDLRQHIQEWLDEV